MSSVTNISPEYINESRYSLYPFTDYSTLTDSKGKTIPMNWLLDVYITAIDCGPRLFIKQVDFINKTITFADSADMTVGVVKDWSIDCTIYEYFDNYDFQRPVGKVVINTDVESLYTFDFTLQDAELLPSNYTVINQKGIRGIVIDNKVITGNIHFAGSYNEFSNRQGVVVYSYNHTLNFQVVGDPDGRRLPDPVCIDTPPSVHTICVETSEGSPLALAVEVILSDITVESIIDSTISSVSILAGAIKDISRFKNHMISLSWEPDPQGYPDEMEVISDGLRILQVIEDGEFIKFIVDSVPDLSGFSAPYTMDIIVPNIIHVWHRHCEDGVIVPTIIDDICINESGPRFKWFENMQDPCEPANPDDPCEDTELVFPSISTICLYPIDNKFWIVSGAERGIMAVDQMEREVDVQVIDGADTKTITDIRGAITIKTVGTKV